MPTKVTKDTKKKATKVKATKKPKSIEEDKNSSGLVDEVGTDNVPNNEPTGNAQPLFFMDDEVEVTTTVHIFYNKDSGKIERIVREGLISDSDAEAISFWGHTKEVFTFGIPTYDELTKHRRICQYYNQDAQRSIVDAFSLRERLLVWHLKDWTIRDSKGKKVDLEFDTDGSLSDDTLDKINKIPSGILDVVMTQIEKKILLS